MWPLVCEECKQILLRELFADCCSDRSPGDMSDDDDARDYQDFSSNDDLSDIDASDEQPPHLSKLHATRLNFPSQVCCFTFLTLGVVSFIITLLDVLHGIERILNK